MDDCEFSLRGRFEQEFLDRDRGGVGQDDLVGMDVLEGVAGDLIVHLVELVDDFFDSFDDFGAEVFGAGDPEGGGAGADGGRLIAWAATWRVCAGIWMRKEAEHRDGHWSGGGGGV